MQECGRLDVAGLAARIILVAECITLVGGCRLDVAGGRVNNSAGGLWPSGRDWWQSVSCCERSRVSVRVMQEATF